jgi:hypothetical protein
MPRFQVEVTISARGCVTLDAADAEAAIRAMDDMDTTLLDCSGNIRIDSVTECDEEPTSVAPEASHG